MKILIIGLGSIGQRHCRNLKRIDDNIDILAYRQKLSTPYLAEDNSVLSNSKTISKELGIAEVSSFEDGLTPDINAVVVSNPSSMHFDFVKKALEKNVRVFVEKPVSNKLSEVIELNKTDTNKKIFVGLQYRFHPLIERVKCLLEEKKIGDVVSVNFENGEYLPNWHPYEDYSESYAAKKSLGGGALVTQIHEIDCCVCLFGKPMNLFAVGGQNSNLKVDVEDSVQILLGYKNKKKYFPVSISLNYLRAKPKKAFTIVGDLGTIEGDLTTGKLHVWTIKNDKNKVYDFSNYDRNEIFLREIRSFINFCHGIEENKISINDALPSAVIADAAKQSIASHQTVEFEWSKYD